MQINTLEKISDFALLEEILNNKKIADYKEISNIYDFIEPFLKWADQFIVYYEWMDNSRIYEQYQIKLGEELINICIKSLVLEIQIKKYEFATEEKNSRNRLKIYLYELIKDKKSYYEFFNIYNQLLKVLLKKIRYFVLNFNLMSSRVNNELAIIKETFNLSSTQLTDIHVSLGDAHNGGATVCELVFGDNSIMYKPRDNTTSIALQEFLNWLAINTKFTYRTPIIINRSDYSFEEKILNRPCTTSEQLLQYYLNFGYISGVLYLLNGIDYHYENVIADGEHPMLIDNETILHPNILGLSEKQKSKNYNILSSSLFPNPQMPFDLSALMGDHAHYDEMVETIQNIEDDNIGFGKEQIVFPAQLNLPKIDDQKVLPTTIAKEYILKGLKEFFEVIIEQRSFLLSEESPLQLFKDIKVRVLLRHTMRYHEIKIKSLHPDHIKTLDSQRSFIEKNLKAHKQFDSPIVQCEIESLLEQDIPYFYMFTSDINIYPGTKEYSVLTVNEAPFEALINKVESLDMQDYMNQLEIIKGLKQW